MILRLARDRAPVGGAGIGRQNQSSIHSLGSSIPSRTAAPRISSVLRLLRFSGICDIAWREHSRARARFAADSNNLIALDLVITLF